MRKIELSLPALMSLLVNSTSASDEIEEDDVVDEGDFNDALSMSDEDFEKFDEEDFEDDTDVVSKEDEDEDLGDDEEEESKNEANEKEPTDTAVDDGSEQAEDNDESDSDQPNEDTENQPVDDKAYQEAFKLLYGKPIKASGREVQLRNAEHAMNFIEMGVDYNKKMHSMKPHLRTLKTLEKEGLLAAGKEERLNLLIEIEKGNKDALKRFIAESDIDPLDLADEEVIEEGRQYTPQNHMISDQEVEIEEALNSIEGSPTQQRTLDVMTKQFDAKSRQVISENPHYIVALNDDIASGVYDQIMETAQYRRDMRQVPPNVSDMELYISIVSEASASQSEPPHPEEQVKPSVQKSGASKRRRVAMSGSRSSNKQVKKEYDPVEVMSMSDEDFEKKFGSELL
ncbi:MAG: hypothetical protein DRJ64_04045 [Thermoprotei archaeon]|nr:MAG: hypothetical protein DRJ64_04045 [Thermoprotei archaeon]